MRLQKPLLHLQCSSPFPNTSGIYEVQEVINMDNMGYDGIQGYYSSLEMIHSLKIKGER